MAFDPNSPAESHAVLSGDIDQIRENCVQLRKHESGASAPSNLVAGMLWYDTNGPYLKIRKADNGSWLYVLLGTATCTEGQVLATPAEINKACDLTSNAFFTSGGVRKILLYENVAPTGWTIQNTLDDKLVFVTKGSVAGGQTGGAVHSAGTWTQLPHTHLVSGISSAPNNTVGANSSNEVYPGSLDHQHTISINSQDGATAATWRPAAYCCIIAALD